MPNLSCPQPMLTFEPTMPADVHDQLTDKVIRWKPEWSETWHECRYYVLGVVEWKGHLLDGWAPTKDALDRPAQGAATPVRPVSPSELGLTGRQMEVVALMMRGKSNKAISRILDVAEPTVKHHVTAILKALKVTNRTEAVLAIGAQNWKLPQVDERK